MFEFPSNPIPRYLGTKIGRYSPAQMLAFQVFCRFSFQNPSLKDGLQHQSTLPACLPHPSFLMFLPIVF